MSRIRYLIYAFAGLFFTFGLLIGMQVGTESKPDQRDCVVISKTGKVENIAPATKKWDGNGISFEYPGNWCVSSGFSASEGTVITLSNRKGENADKSKALIDVTISNFKLSGSLTDWFAQKKFSYQIVGGDRPTYSVIPIPGLSADSGIVTKAYYINNNGSIWEINLIAADKTLIEQFDEMFKTIKFGN